MTKYIAPVNSEGVYDKVVSSLDVGQLVTTNSVTYSTLISVAGNAGIVQELRIDAATTATYVEFKLTIDGALIYSGLVWTASGIGSEKLEHLTFKSTCLIEVRPDSGQANINFLVRSFE